MSSVNQIIVPESPENFDLDGTGSTLSHLPLKLTFVCTFYFLFPVELKDL